MENFPPNSEDEESVSADALLSSEELTPHKVLSTLRSLRRDTDYSLSGQADAVIAATQRIQDVLIQFSSRGELKTPALLAPIFEFLIQVTPFAKLGKLLGLDGAIDDLLGGMLRTRAALTLLPRTHRGNEVLRYIDELRRANISESMADTLTRKFLAEKKWKTLYTDAVTSLITPTRIGKETEKASKRILKEKPTHWLKAPPGGQPAADVMESVLGSVRAQSYAQHKVLDEFELDVMFRPNEVVTDQYGNEVSVLSFVYGEAVKGLFLLGRARTSKIDLAPWQAWALAYEFHIWRLIFPLQAEQMIQSFEDDNVAEAFISSVLGHGLLKMALFSTHFSKLFDGLPAVLEDYFLSRFGPHMYNKHGGSDRKDPNTGPYRDLAAAWRKAASDLTGFVPGAKAPN